MSLFLESVFLNYKKKMLLFLFYKAHNKSKLIPLKQSLNITTTTNIVTFQEFIMW